jgi:hypothetical protein
MPRPALKRVWRQGQAVRVGQRGNPARFCQAANHGHVRPRKISSAVLDDVPKGEARGLALAGRDRHRHSSPHFRQPWKVRATGPEHSRCASSVLNCGPQRSNESAASTPSDCVEPHEARPQTRKRPVSFALASV